jgi:PD-(D/E)XK nuclease superfamily
MQPRALLGLCFHAVMAAAHRGELESNGGGSARRDAARERFDNEAAAIYARAHPLVRAKYRSHAHLPYYNLLRERAALRATEVAAYPAASGGVSSSFGYKLTEKRLASRDGSIAGRPDFVDAIASEVVDYKTGTGPEDPQKLSDAELRQLRLYAHLAHENGLAIARAVVVRADGQRASAALTNAEVNEEATRARRALQMYNEAVGAGRTFEELATPSTNSCRGCQCIPFCERFWVTADSTWRESVGVHVEGEVRSVASTTLQGATLFTFGINVERGTLGSGTATMEQLPAGWVRTEGVELSNWGGSVRITGARVAVEGECPVLRADRASTLVWELVLSTPPTTIRT